MIISKKKIKTVGEFIKSLLTNLPEMLIMELVSASLTFYGLCITWQEPSPDGTKPVVNAWPDGLPTSTITSGYRQYCHVGNTASECRLVFPGRCLCT